MIFFKIKINVLLNDIFENKRRNIFWRFFFTKLKKNFTQLTISAGPRGAEAKAEEEDEGREEGKGWLGREWSFHHGYIHQSPIVPRVLNQFYFSAKKEYLIREAAK